MKSSFTASTKLAILFCVALSSLSACSNEDALNIGVEPSLGVPITVFRDQPVVTADLGVLGTIQTTLVPDVSELALEPTAESDVASLLWLGIGGLVVTSFVIMVAASHQEGSKA